MVVTWLLQAPEFCVVCYGKHVPILKTSDAFVLLTHIRLLHHSSFNFNDKLCQSQTLDILDIIYYKT